MKKLNVVLVILLVLLAGVLFWANRAQLMSPYDAVYWKDRFEHSQWQLPLSDRTLGDNGLYAYEGYQLVYGIDPTKYNAEIPPLGKYAIGAVIQLAGNGYWYGVTTSIMAALLFYVLAKIILKNTTYALLAATWFSFDLIFLSQWTATMLDTLHLSALLLFFILLHYSVGQPYRPMRVASAGLALGIFSAIKYPILSVILLTVGGYYIWKKTRSTRNILIFLVSAIGMYVLSYARYFLLGHTLLDWLRVQKWMFMFYTNSRLESNIGSIWTTLLFDRSQNLFTKLWQPVPEWSVAWPIITILSAYTAYRTRKNMWVATIWVSVFFIMLFYTFVPFWTRYLLLTVPFLYIGAAVAIRTFKPTWVVVACACSLLFFNAYAGWHAVFPTPEADVGQFLYDWKHGFFQDMYERFTDSTKRTEARHAFHRNMQRIIKDGDIESISITAEPVAWKQFASPQYIVLEVTYTTRNLGGFTEKIRLPIVNENNRWRIPWQPQYLIAGFTGGDSLKTTVIPGRRGSLISQGTVLASDFPSYMVWITPQKVEPAREQEMLIYLEKLFGGPPGNSAVNLYHRYMVNSQPDWPAAIGILPHPITAEVRETLLSYPGITLTPATGRYIRADDRTGAAEQTYNDRLTGQNGGTLEILDSAGKIIRTLIHQDKKDGEDVLL